MNQPYYPFSKKMKHFRIYLHALYKHRHGEISIKDFGDMYDHILWKWSRERCEEELDRMLIKMTIKCAKLDKCQVMLDWVGGNLDAHRKRFIADNGVYTPTPEYLLRLGEIAWYNKQHYEKRG